jgi:hypothetical protein
LGPHSLVFPKAGGSQDVIDLAIEAFQRSGFLFPPRIEGYIITIPALRYALAD